ncbi:hypothetical protein SKAU_G00205070 [Synaphobranchus kaupii]|uniref:Uncharacterized protein n=1 Tax=Synaphobranchus kaupii TaxID=118154 RepID=A0A9Q1IYK5_SYNKA|nr:hypothetical protein SKAU_G00205070 [Synaphobranchus kaupii]
MSTTSVTGSNGVSGSSSSSSSSSAAAHKRLTVAVLRSPPAPVPPPSSAGIPPPNSLSHEEVGRARGGAWLARLLYFQLPALASTASPPPIGRKGLSLSTPSRPIGRGRFPFLPSVAGGRCILGIGSPRSQCHLLRRRIAELQVPVSPSLGGSRLPYLMPPLSPFQRKQPGENYTLRRAASRIPGTERAVPSEHSRKEKTQDHP